MRTSVMHVVPHRPPGTEYGAKIAFHKELNTTPPKYMLRHAQTNQQKLLNLELVDQRAWRPIGLVIGARMHDGSSCSHA